MRTLTESVIALMTLCAEVLSGRIDEMTFAKRLVELAFESGIPASILMEHLTESGIATAEHVADIAEWARIEGQRLRGEE